MTDFLDDLEKKYFNTYKNIFGDTENTTILYIMTASILIGIVGAGITHTSMSVYSRFLKFKK